MNSPRHSWLTTTLSTAPVSRPVQHSRFGLLALAVFGAGLTALAQEWTHLAVPPANKAGAARWVQPLRGELIQLESATLDDKDAYPDATKPDRFSFAIQNIGKHTLNFASK